MIIVMKWIDWFKLRNSFFKREKTLKSTYILIIVPIISLVPVEGTVAMMFYSKSKCLSYWWMGLQEHAKETENTYVFI